MNDNIILRDVIQSELPIFFEQQRDPESNHMAAFTSRDPHDRDAFMAHWARILADEANTNRTI
ncbi:MAG: GNAT family N-acetyltransferase, partial [Ktedonobacterales bacterium]